MPTYAQTINNLIHIATGELLFIPSGSDTIDGIPLIPFTSASYEITCSANTNGNLAPTDNTGSFLLIPSHNNRPIVLLYTTSSNPEISSSIYTPRVISKANLSIITASVTHNDTAAAVATATFTAISKSISDDYTRRVALVPPASSSLVTKTFSITQDSDRLLIQSNYSGNSHRVIHPSSLTSSYGFTIKNRTTGSGTELAEPGTIDPSTAAIKMVLTGNRSRNLSISSSKGDLLFVSESGRVGIGTKDPKQPFDVRTTENTADGTKLILRSGRGDNAVQPGDSSGEIDFIIESGSFNDIETSGSLAKLRADVESVGADGATGRVVLSVAKDATIGAIDIIDWRYNGVTDSGFFQEMSASILVKDFSNSIRSKLEFQKSSNSFSYMSLQTGSMYGVGNINMDGTGSFGCLEGGTF